MYIVLLTAAILKEVSNSQWSHLALDRSREIWITLKMREGEEKLGFSQMMISKYSKINTTIKGMQLIKVAKIEDVVEYLFG